MSSTRKQPTESRTIALAVTAAVGATVLLGGCQRVLPPKNEPAALIESQFPYEPDEATRRRDFEKSTLYYPSGTTVAGSTRAPLAPRAKAGQLERNLVEPALFLTNAALLPFTYFVKPPFDPYDWKGVVTPASYTVQPAYPAEAAANASPDGGGGGGNGVEATDGGPVPPAQAPVPGISEPVRNPSGEQPPLPTENQGVTEITGSAPDANPQPVPPSGGAGDGGTGSSSGGGGGGGGAVVP